MRWLSFGVGYAHESVGGTEIYVHRLNLALRARGIEATAAFFGKEPGRTTLDGVPIIGLAPPPLPESRMDHWSCKTRSLKQFQELLRELKPDVVHFHATLQIHSPEYFEAAKNAGARTLWTYHAASQSCLQTALLREGEEPCDGRIDPTRCTRCCLVWSGLPKTLAPLFSWVNLDQCASVVPARLRHPFERRAGTELFRRRFSQATRAVDFWLTHSRWCETLLRVNEVPRAKLLRLPLPPPLVAEVAPDATVWAGMSAGPRLLFAGRLLDIKGAHTLLEALRGPLRGVDLALALLASPYENYQSPYERRIVEDVSREPRSRLVGTVRPAGTLAAMAAAHVVVVPSICLETGPYTVLEALWTGARVIGSNRGGIPERLEDDALGSTIFEAGSASALGAAIRNILPTLIDESDRKLRAATYRATYQSSFDAALDDLLRRVAPNFTAEKPPKEVATWPRNV